MKKYLSVFLLATLVLSTFGQDESEILKKSHGLIDEKKYDSAFKLLHGFDPKNDRPSIALLKEEIVLNYFVKSIMHQLFGLKDLKSNEDIYELRGQEGISSMYNFPVSEILDTLIKKYPENYELYKGLAEYYYEVHLKYGDNWFKKNDELLLLIERNYNIALDHNVYDYLTYYALGYISVLNEKYKESIPLFQKSISLNNDYASSYYNLAYAYLYLNDRENAILNAQKSLDLYQDQVYKADAARMLATIYKELNNEQKAIEYYELSDKIDPNNYFTLKPLLTFYLKSGDGKYKVLTDQFYKIAPGNPTIYNDLSLIYFENNKLSELAQFYKLNLSESKLEPKVKGNLNFYLGRIYIETDKKLATEYFVKARGIFAKIYDKDNEVFKAIDNALKELK